MEALRDLISTSFEKRVIDLTDRKWHHGIPRAPGWYYLETDTPLEIFMSLPSPMKTYRNAEEKELPCRNYDLRTRAGLIADSLVHEGRVIHAPGVRVVYSGMAQLLGDRARDHTFGHYGTPGLALARYEALRAYNWSFCFKVNGLPSLSGRHDQITLKLGEQMWRALNGWPLLCSD